MEQLALFGGTGPFTKTVSDLGVAEASKSLWASNIGAMVGDLTDIVGSMKLAYELEDLDSLVGEREQDVSIEPIKRRFLEVQGKAVDDLRLAFQGEEIVSLPRLPNVSELFTILTRSQVFSESSGSHDQALNLCWAPFNHFFRAWDIYFKDSVEQFRLGLCSFLKRFGSRGLRFDHLEMALHESIDYRLNQLLGRIPEELELKFKDQLAVALKDRCHNECRDAVEEWFAPDHWLGQFLSQFFRALNSLLQFRFERLQAVVEAACRFDEL